MDKIMGVATGIAVVAMAKKHAPNHLRDNFGDLLIAEGGNAAELGRQWNEGLTLIKQGNQLAGWFVGRKQNLQARELLAQGVALRLDAEQRYNALTVNRH